jgi:hypothetical protein
MSTRRAIEVTAGNPGAGISGLFFVVCALWMPVVEIWKWSHGQGDVEDLKLALRLAGIAACILFWVLGAGWLLILIQPTATATLIAVAGLIGTSLLLGTVLGPLRTLAALVERPQQDPT